MEIRALESKDKLELLDMMIEFYASPALIHHTPKEVLEKVIDDCLDESVPVRCFVCVENGEIIGYTATAEGYSTEYGGMSVMIEDLFVKQSARHKGVGSKLLDYVENFYTGKAVRLRLEVEPTNAPAIAAYQKTGFTDIPYRQMGKILRGA